MARNKTAFSETVKDLLHYNGRVLTIFAVALILGTGVAIVENPANWWISLVAICAFFVVVILFLNAKGFFKGVVAFLTAFVLGGYSFKFGATMDQTGPGGSVWMSVAFAAFFSSLAISYMWQSTKSRWGTAMISTVIGFVLTFILATFGVPVIASSLLSGVISVALFSLLYFYGRGADYKGAEMPVVGLDTDFANQFTENVTKKGWKAFVNRTKSGRASVVVWSDVGAFQLLPVSMDNSFGIGGRKNTQLVYHGEKISPWLLHLSFSSIVKKSSGADIMLVLLDVNNKNSSEPRVIGVSVPDSSRKVPVGIIPARDLVMNPAANNRFLDSLENHFGEFVLPLNEKQRSVLGKMSEEENQG